jgi:hypothetical protein
MKDAADGQGSGSQREYFASVLCGWALLLVTMPSEEPVLSSLFSSLSFLLDTYIFLTL